MRQLDLTPRDIADRLAVVSQSLPLGAMEGAAEKTVRAEGRAATADGVANVVLRAWENGARVQLRDVAVVRESFADGALRVATRGETAILINIQRSMTADTLRAMAIAQSTIERFRAEAPPSVTAEIFDIQGLHRRPAHPAARQQRLAGLPDRVLVLLVFLNVRVAFWVAVGVPISLLATFAFMLATGQSINAISLVALILVLGIIVDDAIVVGEHAVTLREQGLSPHEAAEQGAIRMFLPVLAIDHDDAGRVFPAAADHRRGRADHRGDPARHRRGARGLADRVLPDAACAPAVRHVGGCETEGPAFDGAGGFRPGLPRRHRRGLRLVPGQAVRALASLAFRWRYVTVAAAIATLVASAGLLAGGRVGFSFFPVPEPDVVFANVTFAPGLSDEAMLDALGRIEASARTTAAAAAPIRP